MRLNVISENPKIGCSAHGEYELGVDPPLLPCPFCGNEGTGGEDEFITVENTHTPYYTVTCEKCGATGPESQPDGYDGKRITERQALEELHWSAFRNAIRKWNARAENRG